MAVELETIKAMALKQSSVLVADEDLYLDREGKVLVCAEDKRAATLLARKGQVIPERIATRLKLTKDSKPESVQKADTKDKLNFGGAQKKQRTVAPEEIETRQTRPEAPTRTR